VCDRIWPLRVDLYTEADPSVFSTFGWTGDPQKGGSTGQRISESNAHFLARGPLYGVLHHLKFYLVMHDVLLAVYLVFRYLHFTMLLGYFFPEQKIYARVSPLHIFTEARLFWLYLALFGCCNYVWVFFCICNRFASAADERGWISAACFSSVWPHQCNSEQRRSNNITE